jgi:hypothetical protein
MAIENENILVDFDYQNIIIIDPNKIIDNDGNVKERAVRHENLVMYANLECKVLPRTKLIIGATPNNTDLQNLSIATINFLNPGNKKFLDNSYTDQITGKGTLQGQGVNQPSQTAVNNPKNSNEFYLNQTFLSEGKNQTTDTGLLGIRSIRVNTQLSLKTEVSVSLVDIRGRALFELADNSPYAVFFQFPYPPFTLTIKGWYGKAIQYKLQLLDFKSRFDAESGSFNIDLKFQPYQFTILQDISLSDTLALPHMYQANATITSTPNVVTQNNVSTTSKLTRGYQKIREVYKEYKKKKLIDENLPEFTVYEFKEKLKTFITDILNNYQNQESLSALTNCELYLNQLTEFKNKIYYDKDSWYNKNLYIQGPLIISSVNNTNSVSFISNFRLKEEIQKDVGKRANAITELENLINSNLKDLELNATFGNGGKYIIAGKETNSEIPVDISLNDFYFDRNDSQIIPTDPIDYKQSYQFVYNSSPTGDTDPNFVKYKTDINNELTNTKPDYFVFDGFYQGSKKFIEKINDLEKELKTKKTEIENELTNALKDTLELNLGFKPTIKNMVGVIMANAEAFLRILDEVHKNAWNKRDDPTRRKAILDSISNSASVDRPKISRANSPVFPWPQFIVEDNSNPNKTTYQIKYPGDYPSETGSNDYNIWPEVEFIEEYLYGFTQRNVNANFIVTQNQQLNLPYTSLNTIEYPLTYELFSSTEDVKFIYEIYERILTYAFYSKLNRQGSNDNSVFSSIMEMEVQNIKNGLGTDNPFLIQLLKNYNFNALNFELILKHISNEGNGESWQNFRRGIYNTGYLKSITENPFYLSTYEPPTQPLVGGSTNVSNFLLSTKNNEFDVTDTYPYVNVNWVNNNLANSLTVSGDIKKAFNTNKTIFYNTTIVQTANFLDGSNQNFVRPFTYFYTSAIPDPTVNILSKQNLFDFYKERSENYDKQFITEGTINYVEYENELIDTQTTSILNTPYFVNAISKGVDNFRNNNQYPYKEAAYLFLNSLPLTTLKEKYKSLITGNVSDLDYMFATFKKFGSVHRLPYAWVLKYGSIWHRYKNWIETGFDFMTVPWDNFDYTNNYDPITQNISKIYNISGYSTLTNAPTEISLQRDVVSGFLSATQMNLGFYPKLINDMNVFYNGLNMFDNYTDLEIQENIDNKNLYLNFSNNSLLNYDFGFDNSDPNRALKISTFFTLLKDDNGSNYFITPSFGSSFNQTKYECFTGPDGQQKLKTEVKNNPAVFNGSVRMFWALPNYGYFDNNRLAINSPDEYLKTILLDKEKQQNFSINGDTTKYSKIDEIFSVFERGILDLFEEHFLNFSKSKYDYINIIKTPQGSPSAEDSILIKYRNFQLLATEMFKIPESIFIGETNSDIVISKIRGQQIVSIYDIVNKFINYDMLFNNGNPSCYNKRVFYSFTDLPLVDKIRPKSYNLDTPYALPSINGTTTLAQSQNAYPDEWRALETYVGFSTIPQLIYSNTGSFITDFFIDLDISFSVENIKDFAPIIKIYATQKLNDNTFNEFKLRESLKNYFESCNLFKNNIINTLMPEVLKNLPTQTITPVPNKANYTGNIGRIETWEKIKSVNDKWIAGNDYKENSLFEDFLFLDRASRNIGGEVYCDVVLWKDKLEGLILKNPDMQLLMMLKDLIVASGFNVQDYAGYVNYYDVNDVTVRPNPSNQGSTSIANDIFGTFLNVDYRNSKTKMVCTFANEASKNLDIPNSDFRNDVFQLNRQSENPLIENQSKKQDWGQSNKLVAFNMDIGRQNQGIFNSFDVNMNSGQKTAEEIKMLEYTANQAGGINVTPQSQSMYNLYKYRVYTCDVSMMGNALIQPKMYFNLRNVPMFSGPYQIQNVSHTISPGIFSTTFSGTRQPVYEISTQDSYLQTIYKNFVTPLLTKVKTEVSANISTNIIAQQTSKVETIGGPQNTVNTQSNCGQLLKSPFDVFTYTASTATSVSPSGIATTIKSVVDVLFNNNVSNNNIALRYFTFIIGYISNGDKANNKFLINSYNFGNIPLDQKYDITNSDYINKVTKNYFCQTSGNGSPKPIAAFNSIKDSIQVLSNRFYTFANGGDPFLSNLTQAILTSSTPPQSVIEGFAKLYIKYWPNEVKDDVYNLLQKTDKDLLSKEITEAINFANQLNLGS